MQQDFFSFYSLSDDDFKKLWSDAIIVLDANVLLDLYRYPRQTSNELLDLFSKLQQRLWIPHQVALEYQRNRLSTINDQIKKYPKVERALKDLKEKVRNELYGLQLRRRHPTIDIDRFSDGINKQFEAFEAEIASQMQEQPNIRTHDDRRTKIEALFQGRVGTQPDQPFLDQCFKDGKIRFDHERPPGYKDAKEKAGRVYYFNGLLYQAQYGDYILWKQLVDQAKKAHWKSVIFITSDTKDDWWETIDSIHGRQELGPRRELVEEIRFEADVERFYVYTPLDFIEGAKEYLGFGVTEAAIEQVRTVQKRRKGTSNVGYWFQQGRIPLAVKAWAVDTYSGTIVDEEAERNGFLMAIPGNERVVLFKFSVAGMAATLYRQIDRYIGRKQLSGDTNPLVFVGITEDRNATMQFMRAYTDDLARRRLRHTEIVIGTLDFDTGDFQLSFTIGGLNQE